MSQVKQSLVLLLLLLVSLFAGGKDYYFKHYQVESGLLHNNVTSVIQDAKGFVWVGTRGGLNRFDGHTFKNHIIRSNNSGANYIRVVREDHKGMIWVGTQTGIFKFDPVTESFMPVNLLPFINVRDIRVDSLNNLWIIARANLYHYDQSSATLSAFDLSATAIDIDQQQNIVLGSVDGHIKRLYVRSNKTSTIIRPHVADLERGEITQVKCVGDDILIGSVNGLMIYSERHQDLTVLLSKRSYGADIYVREIYPSGSKQYIATESGLFIHDSGKVTHLKANSGDKYALNDNAVYSVSVDRDSGIWVGTFFGGLNYSSAENGVFEKYYPSNKAGSFSGSAVREICGDDAGNVWIGTEDAGINRLDAKSGKFSHIHHQNPATGISYPNIHGLLVKDNKLLAGPFVHGLEVMDLKNGRIVDRHSFIKADYTKSGMVMSIFKTADERILVGTTGAGLHEYDPRLKRLSPIRQIPGNSFVYAIAEDYRGTIWTGSLSNGAFFYNPKTGQQGNVSFNKINDTVKSFYTVQGIFEDSRKSLWFATEGGGLIKLDSTRRVSRRFTKADGLPTDNLYRILEDDSGNLWISSLKGLICFNIDKQIVTIYTKSNGLPTDQFNYNSAYKDRNGKMYFGTVRGMIAFYPSELLSRKRSPPPTYLTTLQINNKDVSPGDSSTVLNRSLLFTDSVTLNHDQSSFNIEFAALDFSSPDVVKYRYRLEGLEKEWTYLSSNRKAYFTGLPAGLYRFVVQAESNIGHWSGEERSLVLTVLPPFWKSNLAYFLYSLCVVVLISTLVRTYHHGVKRKNSRKMKLFKLEKEREVYQAKIEFFTNVAHEIQTPLTLIKGPVEWALCHIDDQNTVQRNLLLVEKNTDRLVTLTRQLLDFRKMEVDQYGLSFVMSDINLLLVDCLDNFQGQIERKQMRFKLILPDEPVEAPVDREAFCKILSNLLSNAIKYGDKNMELSLLLRKNCFKILVLNDGEPIGQAYRQKVFEPFFRKACHQNMKGTGIGLSLAKSLAELHGGKLLVIPHSSGMNAFELSIPLTQEMSFRLDIQEDLNDHERAIITS